MGNKPKHSGKYSLEGGQRRLKKLSSLLVYLADERLL